MKYFMAILIVAVLSFEYLIEDVGVLPHILKFTPEIYALLSCILIVAVGVRTRFEQVRAPYWILFAALAVVVTCGIVVNAVSPGPIVAGIRSYLRAIPFFFLPAVLFPSDEQLRAQFRLIGFFCLLQLPIAIQQRIATRALGTGDLTYGTLMDASQLALFLLPCAGVLTAFFLRRRLSFRMFVLLLVLVLAPTTLNATKSALVLAPIVLLVVFIVGSERQVRFKNAVLATVALSSFAGAFIYAYDYFKPPTKDESLVEFFSNEERLESYLDRGREVGDPQAQPGKIGSIRHALELISRDPVTLAFGVGIGNVSESSLGQNFTGKYFTTYGNLVPGSFARLISELGLFGVGLVSLLYLAIFRDCLYVGRRDSGMTGALALGWTGAVVALFLGLAQSDLIQSPALSVLFWYFTGIVAARRAQIDSIAFSARHSQHTGSEPKAKRARAMV